MHTPAHPSTQEHVRTHTYTHKHIHACTYTRAHVFTPDTCHSCHSSQALQLTWSSTRKAIPAKLWAKIIMQGFLCARMGRQVTAAIVTCGGLCPGLNDVIAGLVNKLSDYGVPEGKILGIRYGFR